MRPFSKLFLKNSVSSRFATSAFANVKMGPPDPILGLTAAFVEDPDPRKVSLGAGVYRDDNNKPYVLECVKKAAPIYNDMDYAGISGIQTFVEKAQKLAFTPESIAIKDKRLASTQTLSGTGALRVGADFMNRFYNCKKILLPNPTWGNHNNVFRDAGFQLDTYTYYNKEKNEINLPKLLEDIKKAPSGSIVLLHACAHNPTGMDPTQDQWKEIANVIVEKEHFPFIDMAYQGFASGCCDKDAFVPRLFVTKVPSMILCQSFAKNFGLYGQRTGACHLLCADAEEAKRVLSQLKIMIRPMYSNPPIHGARIVDKVLGSPELTELWKKEVKGMADRMNNIRIRFVDELAKAGSKRDWSHIKKQIGMMAYTGITKDQVALIKSKWHIYMTDDGRAAISGLNSTNVVYVAQAFHDITK